MTVIVRAFFDTDAPFYDILRAYNIRLSQHNLGGQVLGFVYRSRKGVYHVVLNQWLSKKRCREVFFHELKHITKDLPQKPYIIGLDMQYYPLEKKADMFLQEAVGEYKLLSEG